MAQRNTVGHRQTVNYLTDNISSPKKVKGARQSATYIGVDSR